MNRCCSRNWRTASTTRRLMRRKSPVSSGRPQVAHALHQPIETPCAVRALQPAIPRPGCGAWRRPCRTLPASRPPVAGINSGGSCRSASMTITASPAAWSSPAVIAVSLPKLRDRLTTATRSSDAAQRFDHRQRGVGAAVVDIDHLPAFRAHRGRATSRRWNGLEPRGLVERRHDHGDGRPPRSPHRQRRYLQHKHSVNHWLVHVVPGWPGSAEIWLTRRNFAACCAVLLLARAGAGRGGLAARRGIRRAIHAVPDRWHAATGLA